MACRWKYLLQLFSFSLATQRASDVCSLWLLFHILHISSSLIALSSYITKCNFFHNLLKNTLGWLWLYFSFFVKLFRLNICGWWPLILFSWRCDIPLSSGASEALFPLVCISITILFRQMPYCSNNHVFNPRRQLTGKQPDISKEN